MSMIKSKLFSCYIYTGGVLHISDKCSNLCFIIHLTFFFLYLVDVITIILMYFSILNMKSKKQFFKYLKTIIAILLMIHF